MLPTVAKYQAFSVTARTIRVWYSFLLHHPWSLMVLMVTPDALTLDSLGYLTIFNRGAVKNAHIT